MDIHIRVDLSIFCFILNMFRVLIPRERDGPRLHFFKITFANMVKFWKMLNFGLKNTDFTVKILEKTQNHQISWKISIFVVAIMVNFHHI